MASLSGAHRSQAPGFHRRDLDEDEHDPPSRLGAEGPAARRQGPARPLEDRNVPRRLAQRSDRCALPVDGPINGERFRAYVEQFLVPTLKPSDVVILDNSARKRERRCGKRSATSGRALYSSRNTPPISIRSSRSSRSSKPCCERRSANLRSRLRRLRRNPRPIPAAECAAYIRNAGYA